MSQGSEIGGSSGFSPSEFGYVPEVGGEPRLPRVPKFSGG